MRMESTSLAEELYPVRLFIAKRIDIQDAAHAAQNWPWLVYKISVRSNPFSTNRSIIPLRSRVSPALMENDITGKSVLAAPLFQRAPPGRRR